MSDFYNMDDKIISDEFAASYKDKVVPWGFNGLGYIVYKRTYSRIKEDGTNEEWYETVQRCINGAQKIGADYTKEEAKRLYDHIFNLRCNYPGRMLWQLGTPTVDRFLGNSLLNCWFTLISKPKDFCFVMENLMLGGGVGFSIRREDVHELPKVKKGVNIEHKNTKDATFIVPDSREGWIALLQYVVESFFDTGKSFSYSTILVRGSGEPIKGFGGKASGPRILVQGIEKICNILKNREGKKIRSIDALDICNVIGSIVVAGNIRRSAEIALGDPDDYLYMRAKRWDLGNVPNWRALSNNSIYADNFNHIQKEIWEGFKGNGEPYGFFNLPLSQKYGRLGEKSKDSCEGMNPCLPSWATILTPNGIRQLSQVNIGDYIWSSEGWTKVINKWSNGVKPVYKVSTTGGIFYGTKDHKVVSRGEKIEVGDCDSIDTLVGHYDSNVMLDPRDIMDGLVVGDGSVHKASNNLVHLCIGQDDQDYFHSEVKDLLIKNRPGLHDFAYEVDTTINYYELPKTYERFVPDRFKYGNKNKVCGFLRGLFTANAGVHGERVSLKTSSFQIVKDVQQMLSSLGIQSYFTTNKSKFIKFSNGTYETKQSYDVNISSDKWKFFAIIGFIQDYKNEKLSRLIDKIKRRCSPKMTYDVTGFELVSEEEVFDITVNNNNHTFWCNGLNISNCGEVPLENKECCNLSELYLNNINTKEQLIDCAKLLYKTQKAVASLGFIHEETNKVVHKNMRLGLGVTGICQSLDKLDWLDQCYKELKEFDKEWSAKKGHPVSIRLTTCKPSGTVSLLAGATPGIHPAFDQYYIRRVRIASSDKLVPICRELGYNIEFVKNFDGSEDHSTVVVEFPCESGSNAVLSKNMSAVRQLELVKQIQTVWADNAVSVTVYYEKEELKDIKQWMKENYENSIKSVSFLLHSEHGFAQAPYESINKGQYEKRIKYLKPISSIYENNFEGQDLEGIECANGACPIK